jgi:uncharacterized membrane protein
VKGLRAGVGISIGAALGLVLGLLLLEDWWIGCLAGVSLGLLVGAIMDQAKSRTFDERTSNGRAVGGTAIGLVGMFKREDRW